MKHNFVEARQRERSCTHEHDKPRIYKHHAGIKETLNQGSDMLAQQRLSNTIFNSLEECIAAVENHIENHNAHAARAFQ